jgi:hypothetical protein
MVTLVVHVKIILEHVVTPTLVVSTKVGTLEFLTTTIPLTPPQIGVGLEITLLSNTTHALEIFATPITTFEERPVQLKATSKIGIQPMSNIEFVEMTNNIIVEKT